MWEVFGDAGGVASDGFVLAAKYTQCLAFESVLAGDM